MRGSGEMRWREEKKVEGKREMSRAKWEIGRCVKHREKRRRKEGK